MWILAESRRIEIPGESKLWVARFLWHDSQNTFPIRIWKTSSVTMTHCEVKKGTRLAYGFGEYEERRDTVEPVNQDT